jgi:serine protease AprX
MKAPIEFDCQNLKASIEAYKSTLEKLFDLNLADKEIIITSFESKITNYEKDVTSIVDRHQLSVKALENSFDIISDNAAKDTDQLGLVGGDEVVNFVNQHELFMNLIADRKQLYKLTLELIKSLDSVLNNHSTPEVIEQVRQARNNAFAKLQRLRLSSIVDESEVIAALLWMTERGKELEDLIAVKNFKKNFGSSYVKQLSDIAEDNILLHLQKKLRYYRIICNISDLNQFLSELYLVESYPSFSIIIAQDNIVEEIRQSHSVVEIPKRIDSSREIENNLLKERDLTVAKSMLKVIQFDIPINAKNRQKLAEIGIDIIMSLGKGEFVVSLLSNSHEIDGKLSKILGFNKIWDYKPKIDQSLKYLMYEEQISPARYGQRDDRNQIKREKVEILESGEIYFPGLLIVAFFNQKYKNFAMNNLEKHNIKIAEEISDDTLIIDLYDHPDWKQAFATVLDQDGLQAIEEDHVINTCNDRAVPLITQGNNRNATRIFPSDLSSEVDEIIAICDNGLDTGDINNIHPDLAGQVMAIEPIEITGILNNRLDNPANFGPDTSGHGTHVAGSVIGKGSHSLSIGQAPITGSAFGSKLLFQANEFHGLLNGRNITGQKIYNLKNLFKSAYEQGARIHSNSWGGKKNEYGSLCKQLDEFMWRHKDFLVIVAAGNEGIHSQPENGIDQSNITVPGTAKNCLTVGASENDRKGEFVDTYGQMSSIRFPYPPFDTNQFVDSINDIAAFSSRGCCQEGRFKPDVVAPGTFVLSTKSSQIPIESDVRQIGSSHYPLAPDHYLYMSGTSMATPLVAGCAARVRQHLRLHIDKPINMPSAALIKATLIHSAQYINYEDKHLDSSPWVDNEQGWGRVTLANSLVSLKDTVKVIFEDRPEGLITGESYEYKIKITDAKAALRIILAYTDYPGENLFNNLFLMLYSPDNKYFYGNDFASEQKPDETNNVEGIIVESPQEGFWRIVVIAYYVRSFSDPVDGNREPQDFALVASGSGLEIVDRQFHRNSKDRGG